MTSIGNQQTVHLPEIQKGKAIPSIKQNEYAEFMEKNKRTANKILAIPRYALYGIGTAAGSLSKIALYAGLPLSTFFLVDGYVYGSQCSNISLSGAWSCMNAKPSLAVRIAIPSTTYNNRIFDLMSMEMPIGAGIGVASLVLGFGGRSFKKMLHNAADALVLN